jgi:soluble lytic murein transglycosylase
MNQYGYTDSAEFIENIPFSETRDYVQAVLRNGQVYRELYGKEKAVLASDIADTSTEPPARITNLVIASKAVSKPAPKTTAKPHTAHKAKKTSAKKNG